MKTRIIQLVIGFSILFIGTSASVESCKGKKINIFSIEDDKRLGMEVDQEIRSNPSQYPILNENLYPKAYTHLRRITQTLLNSGQVQYKNEFAWKTYIIHDDKTLNAFCTPGGYIYVYTGLIKYLESEDQLAGVMGHEIAHADKRHSTIAMTRQYGYQLLLDIVFGRDKGALARVAVGLREMAYGREAETESDEYSVNCLYPTEYDARGAARFFEKLQAQGTANPPEFLSTHPNPGNRVQNINQKWTSLGAKQGGTFASRYTEFKNSLPK